MYLIPQLRGDEKAKYLRKSRTDDPLLSVAEVLAKHEQMLDEWVERNQPDGGPVPEELCFREVGSGETIASRPEIQRLLRVIESPKIKAIMVVEPSRLSRGDLEDIGYLVKILRYTNTIVITPAYAYDLNDARDRDLFERELMRGNEYLEYNKRIMNAGRILSVENGNYIGVLPPYGYRKIKVKEGKRTCHTLEPHPDEAPIVRRIFEMYRDGLGVVKIASQLDKEHVPPPKGERWSRNSISCMIENIHYLGKVRWNYRASVRTVEDGVVKVRAPRATDYLVFEGKHPAIIDQELWDAAHAAKGRKPKHNRSRELSNPLAGLLWCKCGRAMQYRKFPNGGKIVSAPRYICADQTYCGSGSALASDVLAEVSRVLRECIHDFEVRIEAGTDNSVDIHKQLIERLEKKLAELKDLERKQWAEKIKGKIPSHIFEDLNQETVREIEEVHHALCEAQNSMPEPINLDEKLVTFQKALEALNDPEAPIKYTNQLMKACIERITYTRERYTGGGRAKRGLDTPLHLDWELRV